MLPIALQIKNQVLYFNPVMHPADELEKGKLVLFKMVDNAISFHQLDDDFTQFNLTHNKVVKAALKQGHTGIVTVIHVRPDRLIFDNTGDELMVFSLVGGSVKKVEFKPRKQVLAQLDKEKQ